MQLHPYLYKDPQEIYPQSNLCYCDLILIDTIFGCFTLIKYTKIMQPLVVLVVLYMFDDTNLNIPHIRIITKISTTIHQIPHKSHSNTWDFDIKREAPITAVISLGS